MSTDSSRRLLTVLAFAWCLLPGLVPEAMAQAASDNTTRDAAPAAKIAPRGVWSPTVTYARDDLVTSRGSTWRSTHNNNRGKVPGSTAPSTAADWQLFAAGLNPLGPWLNTATYHPNDLVSYLGTTWRAMRTNRNKVPGTNAANWREFAATGTVGTVTVQTAIASADLPDGTSQSYGVFCLPGQQATGGGARGDDFNSEETVLTSSRPSISAVNTEPPANGQSFTGWRITVFNPPGGTAGIRPQVWVACADAP